MFDGGRPKAVLAMRPDLPARLFDADRRRRLDRLVDIDQRVAVDDWSAQPGLREIEVVISGWSAPRITGEALDAMPRLRLVAHAAGSVRSLIDAAAWDRGITVTTAASANALPVAEFTLAAAILALKRALPIAADYRAAPRPLDLVAEYPTIGSSSATVGIIGASTIGRLVIRHLRSVLPEVRVMVADPFLTSDDAVELGVTRVPLHELLRASAVVTLHAPDLPATRGLLGGAEFALMPDGATFINTARPALVDQDALLDELVSGRLNAMLDVTEPEPLPVAHPLLSLPNVLITPHLAGAQGTELARLGESALTEVHRFVTGLQPLHGVSKDALATMA